MKNIVIVGLGLIGGSIAAALRGFDGYTIIGVDTDSETREYAKDHGICDIVTDDTKSAVAKGDIVFLCLHPEGIVQLIRSHRDDFMPHSLITDVCGVKTAVMEAAQALPHTVDFIGSHPMAGKERGGIINSGKALFHGAHYIITPGEKSLPENIALLEKIAKHIGCSDTVITTADRHDEIIAYTSQIMHILAVSICDDPIMFDCLGFEGGSFRDCTRVAALDPALWTELFSMNAKALAGTIERLEASLKAYREALENGDKDMLFNKLKFSSDRKKKMNIERRRGDDFM